MFERYTDRARRIVVLAQEQARDLNHNYIGTEHLLLGMTAEGEGIAALVLKGLGVNHTEARADIEAVIGVGPNKPTGHIPFTPRAKKVLELALREALRLGCNYIGTEHVLLGLVREGQGVACQALAKRGVEIDDIRNHTMERLGIYQEQRRQEVEQARLDMCVCQHVSAHHFNDHRRSCAWRDCGCPLYVRAIDATTAGGAA